MEHVQWNRVRLDFSECHGEVDQIFVLLAHADDPTGTDFQSCRPSAANGTESVLDGVGGTDLSMKGFAGVQIMVHSIDAGCFQAFGLCFVHQAERTADLNRNFLFNLTTRSPRY